MAAATTDANANSSSSGSSFSVKLIIDKREQRVLCAEARKDFVDFLLNFLAMPVGSIARLVTADKEEGDSINSTMPAGCVGELYNSASNMNKAYFQSADSKDYLVTKLHPETKVTKLPLLPIPPNRSLLSEGYWSCREADFVKGGATYMVMDDLTVSPLESMMSILSLLAKFNIKDVGVIEERDVKVGMNEGLELLRAFMHTKAALTTVFLRKKETIV